MKISKLFILGTLLVALCMAVPSKAQLITFTGDVEADFTGTGILTFDDIDVTEPMVPPANTTYSGWAIKDVRLAYDPPPADILYVGINAYETVGDADTDGQDCTKTYGGGSDNADLGGTETVSVYFDLNQTAPYDVIVGVSSGTDISGFTVAVYATNPLTYGTALPTHTGTVYYNPACGGDTDSDPDFEFTILNFSTLPGQGGALGGFDIGAFMGSLDDGAIGEDSMVGSNAAGDARISITPSGTNQVNTPHNFTVTVEQNDGSGWADAVGVTVTPSHSGAGSITSSGPYTTNSSGEVTITVSSAATGTATVNAAATVIVNGFPVAVATDGYGAETVNNQKTWVDARISIGTSGTNPIETPHDFTVTVEQDDGTGWADAAGVTVTPSLSGVGSITSTGPYTTDGNGEVVITVNSLTAGTATVNASGTVTVGGVPIPVATNGYGAYNVSNEKTWAEPCIHIEKYTNGFDADSAPGPSIPVDGVVNWTYFVTNCDDVPLTSVVVEDDNGTPGTESPATDDDFFPIPVDDDPVDGFNVGDADDNGELDPGEIWLYEASGIAVAGQYANVACVDALYGQMIVGHCDPSHYFGQEPGGIFCTFTQGYYGNKGGKKCGGLKTADLIDDLLAYGDVVVGVPGQSITLGSSDCIIDLLPAGGTAAVLPVGNFGCDETGDPLPDIPTDILKEFKNGKESRFNNVLIGQIVALTLNLRLFEIDCAGGEETGDLAIELLPEEFCTIGSDGCPKKHTTPDGFAGMSPGEILALANEVIGGVDVGFSPSEINSAVSFINETFDECAEVITCPFDATENCNNGCDDDVDGLTDCEDPECIADAACI